MNRRQSGCAAAGSRLDRWRAGSRLGALLWAAVLAACYSGSGREASALADAGPVRPQPEASVADAVSVHDAGAPPAPYRNNPPSFCDRPREDTVYDAFCSPTPTHVGSLEALLETLSLKPSPVAFEVGEFVGNVVVVLGHSTALSGRLVSSINPRAIIIGQHTIVAFQRGVQQIELITTTRDTGDLKFYLLTFEQTCNRRRDGCSPGDLYTPRVENGWLRVVVHDDEELKNTPADCRQCHQRSRETPMLLMRELEGPWTHFFQLHQDDASATPYPEPNGSDLVRDYIDAKGDEPYGTIPAENIRSSSGIILQITVDSVQPLVFDGAVIVNERWPYGPDGWSTEARRSPTWDAAYEAFKRGEQLALPHFEPRPTDADKLARLTKAYARYRAGELRAEELPDFADIFPDDAMIRAEIGLQNEPGATPAEALIQVCGSCHNDVLDQSLSRARFSVALSRLDRAEMDAAIERLKRPAQTPGAMPPPEARQLDSDARTALIEYLQASARSAEDDAMLEHAARAGMAGGVAGP